jgi:hypothetical protein
LEVALSDEKVELVAFYKKELDSAMELFSQVVTKEVANMTNETANQVAAKIFGYYRMISSTLGYYVQNAMYRFELEDITLVEINELIQLIEQTRVSLTNSYLGLFDTGEQEEPEEEDEVASDSE